MSRDGFRYTLYKQPLNGVVILLPFAIVIGILKLISRFASVLFPGNSIMVTVCPFLFLGIIMLLGGILLKRWYAKTPHDTIVKSSFVPGSEDWILQWYADNYNSSVEELKARNITYRKELDEKKRRYTLVVVIVTSVYAILGVLAVIWFANGGEVIALIVLILALAGVIGTDWKIWERLRTTLMHQNEPPVN